MRLFELSQPVEAYGYAYNNRDQRVMWRKTFASAEAAYAWAEKKNATVLGTRNLNESSEESCPSCGSADVKTYSDGEKECNHCHHTWNLQGVAEASIPYALSAANYNAEFERQHKARTSSMPAGGGYRGRVELDVESREDYIATGKTLAKAAKAAGQHIEYGLSGGVMKVFSDSMTTDELNTFIDDTLENFDQGVAESKSLSKRVRVVKGPDSGKTGWIREIKHGAFKGAPKTYYVDLDDGSQANNLPSTALRLVKEQSVSEMDKSQTPPGRDSEQGGKEYTAKMTTADKMMKHAHDTMMKTMSDADKVKYGWRNPNIRGNYDDEAKPIRDDGNEGRPGKQRYPGKK
jgi:ribosomal protein L37AE/L43A